MQVQMDNPTLPDATPPPADPDPREEARQLLRRLGWDEGQRIQTRIYAHMPAARKMQIAFHWRAMQLEMLRRQLERENPDMPPEGIHELLLRRIEWAREPRY